jgi:hypothetical protein
VNVRNRRILNQVEAAAVRRRELFEIASQRARLLFFGLSGGGFLWPLFALFFGA